MREFVKPRVLVSRCVEFDRCRYDGKMISSNTVRQLKKHVTLIPVCPELEVGLGVPRHPLRLIDIASGHRLLQSTTDRDITEAMRNFSARFLASIPPVEGIILKNRSPSCGLTNAGIYHDVTAQHPQKRGMGIFASQVMATFPSAAMIDEYSLNDFRKRDHFLTSIFTFAEFHAIRNHESMKNIIQFHVENKYILTVYHRKEHQILSKLITNREKKPFDTVIRQYQDHLQHALARPPRFTSHITILRHALGHLDEVITEQEREEFNRSIDRYSARLISLQEPRNILRQYALKYDEDYLLQQTYFEPYPSELHPAHH